ncbi:MAG TPA: alpha/beta hydrolase [Thermomicrobiales bacterium]|nr:alpha/beta hydrolase [Thermomicrobiales bacterium]
MPDIMANGLRFHVTDRGNGTPGMLLHGFPDTANLWESQIEALVAAGYRAIAPDMRGRGRSERPPEVSDFALPHCVADVAGIMDALDIERAHVIGHDWGAAVAWLFAMLRPERVERLIAVSVGCPGAVTKPTLEGLQKGWYRLLIQFEDTAEELFQRDDWCLLRELLQWSPRADEYIATLSEPGALTAAFNWYRANLPPERLLGPGRPLPAVTAPTMGVFGAHDAYLTEQAMRMSERKVEGEWRYEHFNDAGHWLTLEEPERFNALMLDFLGR